MQVGDLTVDGVSDGALKVPPGALLATTEEQWRQHRQFLDADGLLTLEMGGFVVRAGDRVALVDAGIGPHGIAGTGSFMTSLAALGVRPEEVTDVVLTHLHFDHLGWCSDGERRLFPRATYRCHAADWDFFCGADPYDDSLGISFLGGRPAAELLPPVAGRLELFDGDCTLLPGLDVRSAPGHTPGSAVIVLSSGTERAVLLGDVVHCPAELVSDEWEALADVDRALARRTREALARELEGTDIPVAAGHFPGLQFGRLLAGSGRRGWTFG